MELPRVAAPLEAPRAPGTVADGPAPSSGRGRALAIGSIVLLAMLVGILRFPTLSLSAGRDAGAFAYFGQQILDGQVLYRDLWDHKPPLIHYLDALIFAVGGVSFRSLASFEMVWLTVAGGLLYRLARELNGSRVAASAAALLGTAYLTTLRVVENFGMTETYAAVPAMGAVLSALIGLRRQRAGLLVMAGGCLGLAFFFRLTAAVVALPLGALIVVRSRRWLPALRALALAGAGVAIPTAALLSWFAASGALADFFSQVFTYNVRYAERASLAANLARLPVQLRSSPLGEWPALLFLAGAGGLAGLAVLARAAPRWRDRAPRTAALTFLFIAAWVAVDLVALSAGGRFYRHYFVQPVPSLVLLSAYAWTVLPRRPWARRAASGVWAVVLLMLSPLVPDVRAALTDLRDAVRQRAFPPLESRLAPQYALVVSWVRAHTAPSDTVYFWGAEAELNFLTGRRSPSRYAYLYPLLVSGYTDEGDRTRFRGDLSRRAPAIIVDTSRTNGYVPSIATGEQGLKNDIFSAEHLDEIRAQIRRDYLLETRLGEWDVYRRR